MMKENNLKNYNSRFLKIIQKHESLSSSEFILGSLQSLFSTGQAPEDGSTYFDKGEIWHIFI